MSRLDQYLETASELEKRYLVKRVVADSYGDTFKNPLMSFDTLADAKAFVDNEYQFQSSQDIDTYEIEDTVTGEIE